MVSTPTLSSARLGGILELADRSVPYRELASRLEDRQRITVTDATAGARAFAWSALVAENARTVALVAPSEDRARRWRAELAGWLGEDRVLAFPERETMPFETSAPSGTAVHQRLLTLWRLATTQAPVAVVTSLRALLAHTIPPEDLARRGRTLRAQDRLSWAETAAWLFDLGYEPVTEVSEPGTFSRRGGIIDIYPASAEQPARVELFGDEIETLRAFDPVTQRSQSPQDQLVVLPAREFSMERAPELAEGLASANWPGGGGRAGLTSYAGRLDQFLREVAGSGGGTRLVATPQAARLAELLADRDIQAVARETVEDSPAAGSLVVARVPLAEGFAVPELDLRVFTDAEVFGFRKPRHPERRRRRVQMGSFLADLKPGDHVVHEDHGIARFERFVTREVAGVVREYLELRFAGTDVVALPTERVDKVTRYVGGTPPGLSTLGGREWLATKRKAKKAAEEIARELLRLYAAREATHGFAFGRDTPWQIEMENAFPYTETPDQLQAIEDTKRDMERGRPMDRLIVGDVGYGKTEVALRASFKAVQDGKQVAIVVPTTVLAQQHYETFAERLATFPVSVEMLSRFRSPVEQRAVAAALGTGEIDIVVGTHRVLQKDVHFRDLGLVVIDEEHRFGVKHKERLKQMRTEVDVLSMTATPIPRTLHMALSGVRDISVIETPPETRQPIETHVVERSDDVLREAIVREIDRGGQVYYVHNRVQGIEQEAHRLRELVPTARYVVAHGQMDDRKLERVMVEFADAEHDVLVCTTIIESGLDIPNVNTIVINRAGTLGLAQLYQLRGRVGRSAEKAYAYLLYTKEQHLTEQARKRLQALVEASELGAGFKIAMHDLEIRGAGNILGAEQHGHVAAVGFELYTQLLEEAVNEQRGAPRAAALPEITIDLALSTAIPDDYVPSRQRKLELYRRIAGLALLDDLAGLREELRDRYGPPPDPVRNLLHGVEIKLRAAKAGATEVRARGPELRVVMGRDIQPDERTRVLRSFPKAQAGQRQIRLSVLDVKADWRDALTGLLDRLAA